MYIERVPNRASPPAILLRESYREDGKVKKRTLANLSKLDDDTIERFRAALKGRKTPELTDDDFEIVRSLPHGHVAAVLGSIKSTGLAAIISPRRNRNRDLVCAMIVQRLIDPASKLSLAHGLRNETAQHSLGVVLKIEDAHENDLYQAMDWLIERQDKIEAALVQKHLTEGCLVLYDVTSTYFEGRKCPLAKRGYSRDNNKGKLQIVFGLLCTSQGCPVAVEVFEGNTADPTTFTQQVLKIRQQFGLKRVVWIGDRGMITDARIREDLREQELHWISALRAPAIRKLVEQGTIDRSLFDDQDLAEVTTPDYPDERLVVCRNPLLAEERARKRQELLKGTQRELDKIVEAVSRSSRPLRGKEKIGTRVGRVIGRYKVGKHFQLNIEDDSFSYDLNSQKIEEEAALDGLYVVRTNVSETDLDSDRVVSCYKGLSKAERAFRSLKSVELKVRPIFHRLEDRVRAHVFLCMLSYYVEWHMRSALKPFLFDDEQPEEAEAQRTSPVQKADVSVSAKLKKRTKRNSHGDPVQSFAGVLATLGTVCLNEIRVRTTGQSFDQLTTPTETQQKIFTALGVSSSLMGT